jgi:hypothetical protein
MMEVLAPALLALLFILYGLSQRGRSPGSCAGCTGEGKCQESVGRGCKEAGSRSDG